MVLSLPFFSVPCGISKLYITMTSVGPYKETPTEGILCMVGLLIKLACFVKKGNNICNIKSSLYKLVCKRRSTVLSLPHLRGFPDPHYKTIHVRKLFR
jgi:hypothetical protein